jgi:hypothetical protein
VRSVQLEQISNPHALAGVSALLMSYNHMKPLKPEYNQRLAEWVREGGVLLYVGTDADPFTQTHEWWNAGADWPGSPRHDLFQQLRIGDDLVSAPTDAPVIQAVGKGRAMFLDTSPATFARETTGPAQLIDHLASALHAGGKTLQTTNSVVLGRGPYCIGAVLDESISTQPLRLSGTFADLFTSEGVIVQNPEIQPGSVFLYKSLPATALAAPEVLLSSARVEKIERSDRQTTFTVAGPAGMPGILRFVQKSIPKTILVNNGPCCCEWNDRLSSGLVRFEISKAPTYISIIR